MSESPNGVFICPVWPGAPRPGGYGKGVCFLGRPGISTVFGFFLNSISVGGGGGGTPAAWFVSQLNFKLYTAHFRQRIFNVLELCYLFLLLILL